MEYRIEVKVKNNQLLKYIEAAGYKSIGEFCRLNNKSNWASTIGEYVNLKKTPLMADGNFYPHVYKISKLLNCLPEDLFTEVQMNTALETNKRTMQVNEAEVKYMLENMGETLLLEDKIDAERLPEKIDQLLELLTLREQKVIRTRFGMDQEPKTLKDTAKMFNVSVERIRQIESKALRKLRHPNRLKSIIDYK